MTDTLEKPEVIEAKNIAEAINLRDPEYYINREISMLEFQYRVFEEAKDESNPLLERVKFLAIIGSFMVSYTRARAEAHGLECKIGLMQRPERITLLIIGSLLGSIPVIGLILIKCTLLVLALLTNFTAIHRIIHVRNQMLRENQVQ